MNVDYLKKILDEELGEDFIIDQNSLFRGRLVYYIPKTRTTFENVQQKSEDLYKKYQIVSMLEQDNMYYILKVIGLAMEKPHKQKSWLHALLILLTIVTTSAAGAILRGKLFWEGWSEFLIGMPYAIALLSILTAHEMGHYVTAIRHKVKATLPYYIPFFIPTFNLGTMGAFIKILSPITDRKALLKIGIMGPIAGFVVTLIWLTIGYTTLPDAAGIRAYIETIHPLTGQPEPGTNLILGKSILIWFFNDIIAGGRLPMNEMYHFPFIFAGWVGLLITAINLMPIGQLDGGHISYALFGDKAKYISFLTFGMLVILNFFSLNYLVWTLLIFFIVKFRHPPTLNDYIPLTRAEKILGYSGYIIFILSFIPMPIMIT